MPDVVLMQSSFLGKILPTLSTGKGTWTGVSLMCLAVSPQRGCLPEGFATVGAGEGGQGAGR